MSNLLDKIENLLRLSGKPLSSRTIAFRIVSGDEATLSGKTPWKTVSARIAVDIRKNPDTQFMRVGPGMYALRAWRDLVSVDVPKRRINPLDEEILAVPRDTFNKAKTGSENGILHDIDYRFLLDHSLTIDRNQAEKDTSLVQLIPSFTIFRGEQILSYKRTRKTPEQRLHNSYSIVFGGHLQPDDRPSLFGNMDEEIEAFLFRELYEELSFSPPFAASRYQGVLHLDGNDFERQHAALLFKIDLHPNTTVKSLEPGFQSSLRFMAWQELRGSPIMDDRWSEACFAHYEEK